MRNGRTAKGKQKYLCRDCGRQSRDDPRSNAYTDKRRQEILSTYQEGSSLRAVSRIFGVSRNTISFWIKQSEAEQIADRLEPDGSENKPPFDFFTTTSSQ